MRGRTWLFDLDNTLHDASPHIFPHIHRDMTAYVARTLQLSDAEADRLRITYWHRYGATLTGMMLHHGTDPHHFLRHTHQFPELERMVVFERSLKGMLRRLPGRKILFTNAPQHYAEAVLAIMGVAQFFDAIYAIEHLRFRPKPEVRSFLRLLKIESLAAERCVMIEDSAENLRTAKSLGMQTVLVNTAHRQTRATPAWVDLRLKSVLELPRRLGRLR
ncbi:Pyrimidine 5'-nucleotidase [Sterolibacterium denitrificans]|uniref:Pyrimidine 5'-nucleotidase n=1 Tax=Sterolibacterium denitrificans TaxID=157592 RepID=A0A7Z7MUY7_9PROT|nr:pyrimidine 5'-nucleotidase [Sterolibacterium denitrificans]SMB24989.1 Pyrimidine 5'-nucleotidase [Sterolibacterium denitrificans]